MIPYKDDNPTATVPYVTVTFIVLNILVFFYQVLDPGDMRDIVMNYGAIPQGLLTFQSNQPVHPLMTVLTSMFMHGGVLHIAGNMLYLWIFGNNIEDKLGHVKFVIFYLMCGTAAVYAHAVSEPASTTPLIGASGAVSGVLGAYLLLFPRAQVYTLIFLGIFIQVIRLPALIVIGFWAIIQFVNGLVARGMEQGGVAWFAHVGGFLFGLAVIKLMRPRKRRKNPGWS